MDADLERINARMLALAGKSVNGKPKKTKPSPNKEVVRRAIYTCLSKRNPLTKEMLKTAVGELLSQNGFSRMGLTLRIQEVLAHDKQISQSSKGIVLVSQLVDQ